MKMDEFWGGIPVRPHPTKKGKYQIGCGHHRLQCLKKNGTKEVEITAVHSYSDAQMLRIMINENAQYAARPKLVNSDVEKAKKFLDAELTKYESWKDVRSDNFFTTVFINAGNFGRAKKEGAGRKTILAYLGKPWAKKDWMIQAALATLKAEKEGSLNREALETIPTIDQANVFRIAVKNQKIPKPTQKRIAEKIVKESIGSKDIPDLVAEHSLVPVKKEKPRTKSLPNIIEFLNKCESDTDNLNRRLRELHPHLEELIKNKRVLGRLVSALKQLDKTANKIVTEYEAEKEKRDSTICVKQ